VIAADDVWRAAVCCCVLLCAAAVCFSLPQRNRRRCTALGLSPPPLLLSLTNTLTFFTILLPFLSFLLLLLLFLFHFLSRQIYMFSDMWMWEEAKRFAEHTPQIDLSELNRKQALSLERINAWEEAAQMHAASQDYARAIQIFAQVRLFYFVTSYD
tara:strand:- start:263 stop:730 length:468 start_codon:yes stop_codon:yes gene_type:complete